MNTRLLGLWSCLFFIGCPGLDKAEQQAANIDLNGKVCGDQTLDDLIKADAISDDCRTKVESLLPTPQGSFKSRLIALGQTHAAGGERTLYLIGADGDGNALFDALPTRINVSLTAQAGVRVLAEGDVSLELIATGDLLSIGVVNDYSASMRDADIEVVSEIETDLFTVLPPIYEGEVTQFSTTVEVRESFTASRTALLGAVTIDQRYPRQSTALLDGMGVALDSMASRERPLRVLLVSTDGAENASTRYRREQLLQTIRDEHVVVVMLGALFADVHTLKELAGDSGIYVYARGYGRLKSAVTRVVAGMAQVLAVRLPSAAAADATQAQIDVDGQQVVVPLQ